MKIRELCIKYKLRVPLSLLHNPPTKLQFKSLVKSLDFWEITLRADAVPLDSLKYFLASYMSLMKPHPLWTTCSSNPFEVNKAIIQARMLSGRYMTDQLSRHWTHNKAGLCLLSGCNGYSVGSLEHILLECPALQSTRKKMVNFCLNVAQKNSTVKDIILAAL